MLAAMAGNFQANDAGIKGKVQLGIGEYPEDMEYLGQMIENICYNNARRYFKL